MALNDRILVISDMHHPFSHPDTVRFLRALNKKYKFTRVICIGDEIDAHAMSFHDSDPDLFSPGDELQQAIDCLQPIYKMFPKVDLVESNHGSMIYRKGKHHGIPRQAIGGAIQASRVLGKRLWVSAYPPRRVQMPELLHSIVSIGDYRGSVSEV